MLHFKNFNFSQASNTTAAVCRRVLLREVQLCALFSPITRTSTVTPVKIGPSEPGYSECVAAGRETNYLNYIGSISTMSVTEFVILSKGDRSKWQKIRVCSSHGNINMIRLHVVGGTRTKRKSYRRIDEV